MGFLKGQEIIFKYEYDFAVSGGAVSTINLVEKGQAMAAGLVIKDFTVYVETAITSGGTPTITMGNVADPDGYMIDFFAAATPATAVLNLGDRAGALVWDDTNDHRINYYVSSAANAVPSITIATAALTAGKFQVYFTCIRP